jgi:hypothetical protein
MVFIRNGGTPGCFRAGALSVVFGALLGLAPLAATAGSASLSIGGFNGARGGIESLKGGQTTMLVSAIKGAFKGVKFHFAKTLTPKFLSKVNVVILGAGYAGMQEVAPLSAKEQAALVAFVKSGGAALLFCDNDFQFTDASNSFANPFGLTSTGALNGAQTANYLSLPSDPIQTGPFGTAAEFDTGYPGWFSVLGSSTEVAQLAANGEPEIAYFPAGGFSASSGAVVFFGDSDALLDNDEFTANNQIAILNSLALVP